MCFEVCWAAPWVPPIECHQHPSPYQSHNNTKYHDCQEAKFSYLRTADTQSHGVREICVLIYKNVDQSTFQILATDSSALKFEDSFFS